ncbi:MAG: hypothetical protein J2P57_10620 [Acidimicrobiaceae bacterium]|nr:hypothetical protein [Acidimicrobiaceae bacterium]
MIARPLSVLLLGAATAIPTGAAAAATTTGAGTNANLCIVTIHVTATQATATVDRGCTGGGYHLVAYQAQSNQRALSYPQRWYSEADSAPYVVQLPPCFFQIDFGRNQRTTLIRGASANEPLSGPANPGASTIGPVFSTTTQGFIAGELGGKPCTPPPTTTTTVAVPPTTTWTPSTTLPAQTATRLTPTLTPVTSSIPTTTTPWSVPVAKPSAVATAPTKNLATTGASSGALAAIGVAMVGLGSGAVALTRRLRRSR